MSLNQLSSKKLLLVLAMLFAISMVLLETARSWQTNTPTSSHTKKTSALRVFEKYSQLEKKQDYVHIYDLLSSSYKRFLKEKYQVKNAAGYDDLRQSSEAEWSQFQIIKITPENDGFKLSVKARVEESGVQDTVNSTYYLVQENNKWKIDRWNY